MFAKNKPTKTLTFGENKEHHVVLRHLSKGEKDTYNSRLAELSLSLKGVKKEDLENMNVDKLPDSMGEVVKKINELDYFKVAAAIKSWSAEDPINAETVQEFDEEIFNEINAAVNEMNGLTVEERKN